jgi:hypothetical protein
VVDDLDDAVEVLLRDPSGVHDPPKIEDLSGARNAFRRITG